VQCDNLTSYLVLSFSRERCTVAVMRLCTRRSLDALRLHGLKSDRQRGYHLCISVDALACWCHVAGVNRYTDYAHSHLETGNLCSDPCCELHTRLSEEELIVGSVGQWS